MGIDELASLSRRLTFAGDSWYFFDRLFCGKVLRRFARIGQSQTARIPDHLTRIGFDLLECLRSGARVPRIGSAELALLDVDGVVPQHPRYRGYWYDEARHSGVGMIVGADLVRRQGRYFVIELNHGPAINPRRRALYDTPLDPIVSGMASMAKARGFARLVPIAFSWSRPYLEELSRATLEFGLEIIPANCSAGARCESARAARAAVFRRDATRDDLSLRASTRRAAANSRTRSVGNHQPRRPVHLQQRRIPARAEGVGA